MKVPHEEASDDTFKSLLQVCALCSNQGVLRCKSCQLVYYCGKECQKKNYVLHSKKLCPRLRDRDSSALELKRKKTVAKLLEDVSNVRCLI